MSHPSPYPQQVGECVFDVHKEQNTPDCLTRADMEWGEFCWYGLSLLEGRATANQYKTVLSDRCYPMEDFGLIC